MKEHLSKNPQLHSFWCRDSCECDVILATYSSLKPLSLVFSSTRRSAFYVRCKTTKPIHVDGELLHTMNRSIELLNKRNLEYVCLCIHMCVGLCVLSYIDTIVSITLTPHIMNQAIFVFSFL